jgi:hypothetical protein
MSAKRPKLEDPPREAETSDPLESYRTTLDRLNHSAEQLTSKRNDHEALAQEAQRFDSEREALLSSGADDSDAVSRLAALGARSEIFGRKLARSEAEISEMEKSLADQLVLCSSRFACLGRLLKFWTISREKDCLREWLQPGSLADYTLEQVAMHFKTVAELSSLEIGDAVTVGGLVERATRLLDTIKASGWSGVPPYEAAPVEPASANVGPPGLPYADRGVDLNALTRKLRSENPDLTLPALHQKIWELHPEIFTPPPPDALFGAETKARWTAQPIGSTSVAEDSGFAQTDQLFEILNQR